MKSFSQKFATALLLLGTLSVPLISIAANDVYAPGDTVMIGEFIYNDDFSPSSTGTCTVTIMNPAGATVVSGASMTVGSNGWHYYNSYTAPSAADGEYPTVISCGSSGTGDLITGSKTFFVRTPTLTDSSITASVWGSGSRTLTAFGSLAADVWNGTYAAVRRLTDSTLTGGGTIATASDVSNSETAVVAEILTNRGLINALNNISAADVWAYGTRSLNSGTVDISSASQQAIWDKATSSLSTTGSVGKLLVDNIDAAVSSRGTSTLTAGDVWTYATRAMSASGNSAVATAVWNNSVRDLTSYGNDITAADVWNVLSSTLTTTGSIGKQLQTNVDGTISGLSAQITALNNISAADVWAYGTRSVNSGTVDISSSSQQAIWDKATSSLSATGSIGKLIVQNLDAQVSSRGTSSLSASDVWASATRTLTDYNTSDVATAVWANATRTLTSYGNDITAADVWNVLSSTLTTIGSIGNQVSTNLDAQVSSVSSGAVSNWSVKMGNVDRVMAGKTYRTKVFVLDSSSTPTNAFSTPTATLYDPDRNVVVSNVPLTAIATGVYEYTYVTATSAAQGLWETLVSTTVESGKTVTTNDYWEVSGSPAQVIINSISAPSASAISANITITNEGLAGYEYQYEWCIVTDVNNACGGGNDTYYALAAKFINPGEDWNTALTGTVPSAGTYYFKLVVYFGTDSSGASRIFTVASGSSGSGSGSGGSGGGGGGGGGSGSTQTATAIGADTSTATSDAFLTADLNKDGIVNSIDFSIMLSFWKGAPPYKNTRVDINKDGKVNSVDFSILLYQWKKKK